jgi:hypothetical protein
MSVWKPPAKKYTAISRLCPSLWKKPRPRRRIHIGHFQYCMAAIPDVHVAFAAARA